MIPIIHIAPCGTRLAFLPCGHVIQEQPNGGSLVIVKGYGVVECQESFTQALALFEGGAPCAHK